MGIEENVKEKSRQNDTNTKNQKQNQQPLLLHNPLKPEGQSEIYTRGCGERTKIYRTSGRTGLGITPWSFYY